MAFRLSDFGIPNYDTNVNVLYKNAVEHGQSIVCGEEEYVVYRIGKTPVVVVLRFVFGDDGETPEHVTAHTFMENAVRWHDGIQCDEQGQALVMSEGAWLKAEVINPNAAGKEYIPMLFADVARFGPTRLTAGADMLVPEGKLTPSAEGGVELLARVKSIKPIVMSKLWLFSVIELQLGDGEIFVPVSRDILEKQISVCNEGALCYATGSLSLMKTWE